MGSILDNTASAVASRSNRYVFFDEVKKISRPDEDVAGEEVKPGRYVFLRDEEETPSPQPSPSGGEGEMPPAEAKLGRYVFLKEGEEAPSPQPSPAKGEGGTPEYAFGAGVIPASQAAAAEGEGLRPDGTQRFVSVPVAADNKKREGGFPGLMANDPWDPSPPMDVKLPEKKFKMDMAAAADVFVEAFKSFPTMYRAAIAREMRAGDIPSAGEKRSDPLKHTLDVRISAGQKATNELLQYAKEKYGKDYEIFPGLTVENIANLPSNLSFSVVAGMSGLFTGALGSIASPIVGIPAGIVGAGGSAFKMDKDNFLSDVIVKPIDDLSVQNRGRHLSPDEHKELLSKFDGAANEHALWEAIPEALGTVGEFGIAKLPVRAFLNIPGVKQGITNRLAKMGAKFIAMNATELGTEVATQMGQGDVEARIGAREEAPGLIQAAKEVAPDVVLMNLFMTPLIGASATMANVVGGERAELTAFKEDIQNISNNRLVKVRSEAQRAAMENPENLLAIKSMILVDGELARRAQGEQSVVPGEEPSASGLSPAEPPPEPPKGPAQPMGAAETATKGAVEAVGEKPKPKILGFPVGGGQAVVTPPSQPSPVEGEGVIPPEDLAGGAIALGMPPDGTPPQGGGNMGGVAAQIPTAPEAQISTIEGGVIPQDGAIAPSPQPSPARGEGAIAQQPIILPEGGEDALQERSAETKVSPVVEGGEDIQGDGGRFRPVEPGEEVAGAGAEEKEITPPSQPSPVQGEGVLDLTPEGIKQRYIENEQKPNDGNWDRSVIDRYADHFIFPVAQKLSKASSKNTWLSMKDIAKSAPETDNRIGTSWDIMKKIDALGVVEKAWNYPDGEVYYALKGSPKPDHLFDSDEADLLVTAESKKGGTLTDAEVAAVVGGLRKIIPPPQPSPVKGEGETLPSLPLQKGGDTAIEGEAAQPAGKVPVGVMEMSTKDIKDDPERFQYKRSAGASGVSDKLKDVKKYDPYLAGILSVWHDPADGFTYVVNGHHRHDLAKRDDAPVELVRYLPAKTAEEAKFMGALINIAEGQGTPEDAANVFRDTKMSAAELSEKYHVSVKGAVASKGLALSKLHKSLFNAVVRGEIPQTWGVAIGAGLENTDAQFEVLKILEKQHKKGKNITSGIIDQLIKDTLGTGVKQEEQLGLFGAQAFARPLLIERAELRDYAIGRLSQDKNLFGTVSKSGKKERLESVGNVIDADASLKMAETADMVKRIFDTIGTHKGEINDLLNLHAEELSNARTKLEKDAIKSRFLDRLREIAPKVIKGTEKSGLGGSGQNDRGGVADTGTGGKAEPEGVEKDPDVKTGPSQKDIFGNDIREEPSSYDNRSDAALDIEQAEDYIKNQENWQNVQEPPKQLELSFQKAKFKPVQTPATPQISNAVRVRMESTGRVQSGGRIQSSAEAAAALSHLSDAAQENSYIIITDKPGNVLEVQRYGKGTRGAATIDQVEIMGRVFNTPDAALVYFIHNHPGGRLEPSSLHDIPTHVLLSSLGKLNDIEVRSLIISDGKFVDFTNYSTKLRPKPLSTRKRDVDHPVVERTIERLKPYPIEISSVGAAQDFLDQYYKDQEGALLLDSQNRPVGFAPWPKDKPVHLAAVEILRAIEDTNSRAMIFVSNSPVWIGSPNNEIATRRREFIENMMRVTGGSVKVHDVVENRQSLAESGTQRHLFPMKGFPSDGTTLAAIKLDRKYPLYSVQKANENLNGLTDKEIFERFKFADRVYRDDTGDIVVENGIHVLRIQRVDSIDMDAVAFQVGYGRKPATGEKPTEEYYNDTVKVSRAGDVFSLDHGTLHWMIQKKMISAPDYQALKAGARKWAGREKIEDVTEEDAINFAEEKMRTRDFKKHGTLVQRVLQKIADWLDAFVNLFKRTAQGVIRDFERGRLQKKAPSPQPSPARGEGVKEPGGIMASESDIPKYSTQTPPGGGPEKPNGRQWAEGSRTPPAMDLPEIVEIAAELLGGKYPEVRKKLGFGVNGRFTHTNAGRFWGKGRIDLLAEIFKDPQKAAETLAHEVGHLADWLPDKTLSRGNILGRIASLHHYMKHQIAEKPGAPGPLTPEEKAAIKDEARKLASVGAEKWVDEEITRTFPITPEDVLSIWNATAPGENIPKDMMDYIKSLNTAQKKSIIKEALKGRTAAELQRFAKTVTEKTGKKIKAAMAPGEGTVKSIYEKLIREEIERRRLIERNVVMEELKDFTQQWKPFDPDADPKYTKYRFSGKELYADALSAVITDPGFLKQEAPVFYNGFFNYLENKPEVAAIYNEIQERLSRGPDEVSRQRRENVIGSFKKGHEARKDAAKRAKVDEITVLDSLLEWLDSKDQAVLKHIRKMEGQKNTLGQVTTAAHKAQKLRNTLEELAYLSSEADVYMKDVYRDILKPLREKGIDPDELGYYLFETRVAGERTDIANPLGHTPATVAQDLAAMERDWGPEKTAAVKKMKEDFRKIREVLILPVIRDSGIVTPELMEHIENTKDYATFSVSKYLDDRFGGGVGAKIYKQVGTLSEIENPLVPTILKDLSLMRAARINMAKDELIGFLAEPGIDQAHPAELRWSKDTNSRKPVEPKDPRKKIMAVMVDGKPIYYYVPYKIAEMFEYAPVEQHTAIQIFRAIGQPTREILVSKNPVWMVRNIKRDFSTSVKNIPEIQIRDIPEFGATYIKSLKEAIRAVFKGEMSADIREMKLGKMVPKQRMWSGYDESMETELDRLADDFSLDVESIKNYDTAWKKIKWLWNELDRIGQTAELWGKLAGFKYLKAHGAANIPTTVRNRIGTPNIRRVGSLQQFTNNFFMFSNVGKEGIRSSWRSFKEDPGSYAWKTLWFNIAPKIVNAALKSGALIAAASWLMGGDEDGENPSPQPSPARGEGEGAAGLATIKLATRLYQGIPEYDLSHYNIIPLYLREDGKSVYLRLPEDYEGQIFGTLAYKMINNKWLGREGMFGAINQAQPYHIHPVVSAAKDLFDYYALGISPVDDWTARPVLTDMEAKAGGWPATKRLGKYAWSQVGGNVLYKPAWDALEVDRGNWETFLNTFPGNVLGAYVRVSDQGIYEKIDARITALEKEKAKESIQRKDGLIKLMNGDEISESELLAIVAQPMHRLNQQVIQMIRRSSGDTYLRALNRADTNEEKAIVIDEMLKDNFLQFDRE